MEAEDSVFNAGETQDDISVDTDISGDIQLLPTFRDGCIPTTQDTFIGAAGGTTHEGVDNDDSILYNETQNLVSEVVAAKASPTITYAMLKRVACELVEVAMKQNDASKKVSVCGMLLRVTNLLKGDDSSSGAPGFDEAIEQYLHSFSANIPNLFRQPSDFDHTQGPASIPCNGRPTTHRLVSRQEAFRRPKNGSSKRRSCGFCLEDGHTVNQCTSMAQQGKHISHNNKDPFCYGILNTFAVKQLNHRQHPSPSILSHLVGATHISITNLYAMSRCANTVVVNKKRNREIGINQVIAKVTLLGEGGNPLDIESQLDTNEFYTLTSVMSWIAKSSSKKRVFHTLTNLSEVDDFEY